MARVFRYVMVPELVVARRLTVDLSASCWPARLQPANQADGRAPAAIRFLPPLVWPAPDQEVCHPGRQCAPRVSIDGRGLVLLRAITPAGLKYGIKEKIEYSWVADQRPVTRQLGKGGAKRDKTYRMYDLDL